MDADGYTKMLLRGIAIFAGAIVFITVAVMVIFYIIIRLMVAFQ